MHPSLLPLGARIPAGLGSSLVIADGDFETYSEAGMYWEPEPTAKNPMAGKWKGPPGAAQGKKGLGVVGVAVYAEHPTTEVLSFTYNLKDGRGSHLWTPGQPNPSDLFDYIARGGLFEAHNSAFEWWIWNLVCTRRYGWPPLPLWQVRCTMAKSRASGLPGKLDALGDVLGLQVQKDKDGKRLLDLFSVPRNPTQKDARLRIRPQDAPEDAAKLYAYNGTDIVTEAEASARVPDLEGEELEFWLADQLINRRGVHVDRPSLMACVSIVEQCLESFNGEVRALTGGAVERTSQLERLKGWLAGHGVHMGDGKGSMDEDAIEAKLKTLPPHPPGAHFPPRRALELRQLAGSASVKKVFAMSSQLSSRDRLHDLYNYHGARTGRPTGEGPQPTNLPKAGPKVYRCTACGRHAGTHHKLACPWCGVTHAAEPKKTEWPEAVDDALEVIRTRNMQAVQWYYGDAMLTVSGCLRGLFCAAPGHDLIASDFSAIESVVTAALAGEQWRMDMFHTHGKNYEMAVSAISGLPFAEVMAHAGYDVSRPEWWKAKATGPHHPLRQTLGKVSELASGFGGWVGAWKAFGADAFMTDEEIKNAILKWREASPAIVEFWGGQERRNGWQRTRELFGLEGMAIAAVMQPGQWFHVMRKDGTHTGVSFCYLQASDCLYCHLPSGRTLTYWHPRLEPSGRDWGGEWQLSYEGWNTNPKAGPPGWVRMFVYGGKWAENVVQAVARDLQRAAILNLERAGYAVVLHVYDEDVTEVREGWGSIEEHEALMMRVPAWASYGGKPWPIKAAGGWRGKRYRKG